MNRAGQDAVAAPPDFAFNKDNAKRVRAIVAHYP